MESNRASGYGSLSFHFPLFIFLILFLPLTANAFSFQKAAPSGQTLYYDITSSTTVTVVNPDWSQYTAPTGNLVIPGSVENGGTTYNVTAIGQEAFSLCTGLTGVVIPEGVTSIGTLAFFSCTALAAVTLPTTLTDIRSQAFNSTAYLGDSANWDANGLLYINNYLIACRAMVDSVITVKDGTQGLGGMSMYYNQSIKVIRLPQSLRFISGLAFADCGSIDTIQLATATPPTTNSDCFERASAFTVKVPCGATDAYSSHAVWGQYTIEEYGCGSDPNPPDPPGPVDPIDPNDDINAWGDDGGLVIHVSDGAQIYVFDISSRLLFSTVAMSNVVRIPLEKSGIYIIKREGAPFPKVVIYFK